MVGGFLAGTGWLLFKSGVNAATNTQVHPLYALTHDVGFFAAFESLFKYHLGQLLAALVFGVVLLIAVRVIKRPLVIPAVIGIGLLVFVVGMVVTGSSLDEVRADRWLLGPFESARLWQPWSFRAITGADWSSVLQSWAAILDAVFIATIAILLNISGSEVLLDRDLETNDELQAAGMLNVVSGALGGVPAYHALSLTALADRMKVDARAAGLIAAAIPLAAILFGASVVGLIPRAIVGGVLVFLGLSFIVEWTWDKRHVLPRLEYWVVWVILIGVIVWGFRVGVVLGLVLAVVLFAFSYGRIELVREVRFGRPTTRTSIGLPRNGPSSGRGGMRSRSSGSAGSCSSARRTTCSRWSVAGWRKPRPASSCSISGG